MNNTININKLIYVLLFLCGLIISMSSTYIFPEKYFADGYTILKDISSGGFLGSYEFSYKFYHLTGLAYLPFPIIGAIQYTIIYYIFYQFHQPRLASLTLTNIVFSLTFFLIAIYISVPSKEFITFLFMAFISKYLLKGDTKYVLRILLLFLCFAFIFRMYYFVIIFLSLIFYCISKINFRYKVIILTVSGFVLLLSISYFSYFIFHDFLSYIVRTRVNEGRSEDDVNSIIQPPFETNTWYGEFFAILYGIITVCFPFTSLRYFTPKIILMSIWQLLLLFCVIKQFIWVIRNRKKYKQLKSVIWIFYFIISFILLQGVFEPDLGSNLKHKLGIFPLLYIAIYIRKIMKS